MVGAWCMLCVMRRSMHYLQPLVLIAVASGAHVRCCQLSVGTLMVNR
jgi:hypothetical protein